MVYSRWNPTATRTARSIGSYFLTRMESGNFSGGVRGIWNEVDAVTTGTVSGSVSGMTTTIMTHGSATYPVIVGEWPNIFVQGSSNVTTAIGVAANIENDGSGVINDAVGMNSSITAGGGVTNNWYAFYADPAPAATNKWSYFGDSGAGRGEIKDGVKVPVISYNASSVLTINTNVIAPTNGVHHLGAGLVKTITVPATCYTTCSVMIIPDAAFTTDATGNISLASTAVINRALIFVWDGTKWNPSY